MGRYLSANDLPVSEEQKSIGWKKWLLVLLLMLVGWVIYQIPPRDPGVAFRRAVYRCDLAKVEQMLAANPALVNVTNVNVMAFTPSHSGYQSMNFMDEVTVALWKGMTGVALKNDYDEFRSIEQLGMSPLHIAVSKKDQTMTEFLLKHSANVFARDLQGMTALHLAAMRKAGLVRLLLAYKAEPNVSNMYLQTPLIYSVGQTDPEIMELLLKGGADPNLPVRNNWYPLHSAVTGRTTNSLQLLLKYGARLDVTNSMGKTPLDVARERRATNAVRLLSLANP